VCIVNDTLKSYFAESVPDRRLAARKAKIRSFSWCPPLKLPKQQKDGLPTLLELSASRWGVNVLVIANDANDLVLVRV
jgi:hypothetical protein